MVSKYLNTSILNALYDDKITIESLKEEFKKDLDTKDFNNYIASNKYIGAIEKIYKVSKNRYKITFIICNNDMVKFNLIDITNNKTSIQYYI